MEELEKIVKKIDIIDAIIFNRRRFPILDNSQLSELLQKKFPNDESIDNFLMCSEEELKEEKDTLKERRILSERQKSELERQKSELTILEKKESTLILEREIIRLKKASSGKD